MTTALRPAVPRPVAAALSTAARPERARPANEESSQ